MIHPIGVGGTSQQTATLLKYMKDIREYTINVVCDNCGRKQQLSIEKGKRFIDASSTNGNFARIGGTVEGYFPDSHAKCVNCGCGGLHKTLLI